MLGILAAVLLAAAPQVDTVYLTDGGRLVGTVIEETERGVTMQLADGSTRRLDRREVARIEYADGSVSTPNRPPPPPQQPQPQAPPTYQPPPAAYPPYSPPPYPPPPPYRPPPPPPTYRPPAEPAPAPAAKPPPGMPPILPIYGVIGVGVSTMGGEAASGVSMNDVMDPTQLDVYLEGGVRFTPHVALALYVDIGVGDPASQVKPLCEAVGTDCTAATGRVGLLLRHTFRPAASSTPWLAVGTGAEFLSLSASTTSGSASTEIFNYTGWEMLRLMGGFDLRSNPVLGFGLYGGVSIGKYTQFEDPVGQLDLGGQPLHAMAEAGLRITLFP